MNRQLCAYIDKAFVGTLSENTGVWSFQYDQAWVKQGYELSPGLPLTTVRHDDGGTVRPIQVEARTDVPAASRASQVRMLRSIRFLPIATMAKQLQQAS